MRIGSGRLAAIIRGTVVAVLTLTVAAPASAQFGGLKKKLKAAAASDAVERVAPGGSESAPASTAASPSAKPTASPAAEIPAPGPAAATGGTIVLDEEVVNRIIAGLRAAEAERETARKQDTPYGRYHRAVAAYEVAEPKCLAGRQTFPNRMAGNEKMGKKYTELVENMVAAQGRGDHQLAAIYNDSAMAMQDPACTVKQPVQPDDYYETHRALSYRAEQAALKASGYSRGDYSQVLERMETVLRDGTPAGDLSASEKSAVSARSKELKTLLGIRDTPPPAPAAAAPATTDPQIQAQAAPAVSAAQQQMAMCYAQNTQKNEQRLTALAQRAQAARAANDTAALLAIADTIQQIQSAGCTAGK